MIHHRRQMRPQIPVARVNASIFESRFPYSKKLTAHKSCVNAIAFSHGDGRWLASAGDDMRILLWDFHQETVDDPSSISVGHTANIFCLDFSARTQFIYSGATDEKIMKFDLSAGSGANASPYQTFTSHKDSIRGLSCHPENDDIFLSAGEDGMVALHDSRTPCSSTRPAGTLNNMCEFTGVKYHPQSDKLFFTSDIRGNVCLRDMRMSFDSESREAPDGAGTVLKYVTSITRRSTTNVQPEASSIAVDRDGNKLAVTFLHFFPTIYSTADPYPLAVCTGRNLPDGTPVPEGERTYSNSCTIKHGSFGGPGLGDDPFYTTGSDDFRGYVWKIPPLSELSEKRRVVNSDDFLNNELPRTIGYTYGKVNADRYIPIDLSTPAFRLQGHRSIVNSSIIHPHFPEIATSGVEKHIQIHSPTEMAPNMQFQRTSEDVRPLPGDEPRSTRRFIRALLTGHNMDGDNGYSSDEEQNTIDFFDGVIREHEGINVFTAGMRQQTSCSDSSGE
ncbi:WD40 repeat-like protein [Phellopilus nigrolimitatus]|nr:WD40 repeat-like protein [Phellopilus nigrolimitatus]